MNCHYCPNLEKVIDKYSNYYICKLENPPFALSRMYLRKNIKKPSWCKYKEEKHYAIDSEY